jgi:hypothetical protein
MASDEHFWTCGEVVAQTARMGREPLRSKGYGVLTIIYCDMNILTSNCVLFLILAAFSFMNHLYMCILGQIIGGLIGCITVN